MPQPPPQPRATAVLHLFDDGRCLVSAYDPDDAQHVGYYDLDTDPPDGCAFEQVPDGDDVTLTFLKPTRVQIVKTAREWAAQGRARISTRVTV